MSVSAGGAKGVAIKCDTHVRAWVRHPQASLEDVDEASNAAARHAARRSTPAWTLPAQPAEARTEDAKRCRGSDERGGGGDRARVKAQRTVESAEYRGRPLAAS